MTWLLSALLVSAISVAAAILVGRRQKKAERIMREGSQLENTLKRADAQTLIATALYLAAAALYFSPVALPHKIALGLLILTAFSLHGGNPAYIAAAFFFSFLWRSFRFIQGAVGLDDSFPWTDGGVCHGPCVLH